MSLSQIIAGLAIYVLIRRNVRLFDHTLRRIEFFVIAQILSIPVMLVIIVTRKRFEITRVIPFVLNYVYNCELRYSKPIPAQNSIIVINHQSGLDIWPLLDFIPIHGTVLAKAGFNMWIDT